MKPADPDALRKKVAGALAIDLTWGLEPGGEGRNQPAGIDADTTRTRGTQTTRRWQKRVNCGSGAGIVQQYGSRPAGQHQDEDESRKHRRSCAHGKPDRVPGIRENNPNAIDTEKASTTSDSADAEAALGCVDCG